MHRFFLPLVSVLFLLMFLAHLSACVVVRVSSSAPGVFPEWVVRVCGLFVAI